MKTGKQIKRNVVSLIGKSEKLISSKRLVAIVTASILILLSLPGISLGTDLEIRQETYLYQIPFAQDVFAETFVISTASKQAPVKVAISSQPSQLTPDPILHFTDPIIVHFQFDSTEISPTERIKLLSLLHEFEIPQNAPLTVTGFTCKMGPAEFNIWLSKERAKAVSALLEKEGYTVAKIEGKGAMDLVSEHNAPNRRVKITPFETISAHISTKEETP